MNLTHVPPTVELEPPDVVPDPGGQPSRRPRRRTVRWVAMRGRRVVVRVHRWLSIGLMAWIVVMAITGAWLVVHKPIESWIHPDRYRTTDGDLGPAAALDATRAALPEDATVYSVTMRRNGRGVYQLYAEIPVEGAPPRVEGAEAAHTHETLFVDPGSATVNGRRNEEAGATWWLYRGHMYLWQDYGIAGVFDPESGWCRRDAAGAEPGGVKGVVCDVIPDGMDMVAYLALGFIVVLLTGFYVWYWPGVRRWATALVIRRGRGRFTFTMSLHKVIGFVVWVPLLVVSFTGAAFAFTNMNKWFENVTPAARDFDLWVPPESAAVSGDAVGEPLDATAVTEILRQQYPQRAIDSISFPFDETATYTSWMTRGFDPWTGEARAGNVLVSVDQYSGEILADNTPGEGNVFDQVWDDWSFPLHTGEFGGTATRILWMLLGLTPIALGVTGVTMNLIRRSKRKARPTAGQGV